jgi:hypothetical protein
MFISPGIGGAVYGVVTRAGDRDYPHHGQWGATPVLAMCGALVPAPGGAPTQGVQGPLQRALCQDTGAPASVQVEAEDLPLRGHLVGARACA